MKRYTNKPPLRSALIVALGLVMADHVAAQTFTTLYAFSALSPTATNTDGASPEGNLIASGDILFGTAANGGTNGYGTVFATINGSLRVLHSFTAPNGTTGTNSDGTIPQPGLVLSGDTLYGTAYTGGTNGRGTVFAVSTNGSFRILHSFTTSNPSTQVNGDGALPYGRLILSGSTLYGISSSGGTNGGGTLFSVNTNGLGFTNLHNFTIGSFGFNDGTYPQAGLVLSGDILYGTTPYGGSNSQGTVFGIRTNGLGFTNLHTFTATAFTTSFVSTNSDGASPMAGLTLSGNTLYGTTFNGGTNGNGTVFSLSTNGAGYTTLHTFTALISGTNNDGTHPQAALISSGSTLYGTAGAGGRNNSGTVFNLNNNGTGFTNLHTFDVRAFSPPYGSNGWTPIGALTLSGNTLYGTTYVGGTNDNGTVFSLSVGSVIGPAPDLAIVSSGSNVILTWPTSASSYTLESTANLNPPAVWSTNLPTPAILSGQYTVTNPISGSQNFFRLIQ